MTPPSFGIVLDADDLLATPLGAIIARLAPRRDLIPPIVRGLGPTPLPRPERFYFHFGKAIDTRSLAGKQADEAICFAVREEVRKAVEEGIEHLLLERERDPERALLPRVLAGRLARRRQAASRG